MRSFNESITPSIRQEAGVDEITLSDILRMTEILEQIATMRRYPAIAQHLQRALDEARRQAAAADLLDELCEEEARAP